MANLADIVAVPGRLVPADVRPALFDLWFCYQGLKGFETSAPIAGLLAVWITKHGLLPVDAIRILQDALAPAAVCSITYLSDLQKTLGLRVAQVIEKRKQDTEKAKADADAAKFTKTDQAAALELLRNRKFAADIVTDFEYTEGPTKEAP